MRDLFFGHYRPTTSELDSLWNQGLIVLDANVLLNVYRYSLPTRTALLDILERVQDRLWIPYQFAMEYHRRRLEVIAGQAKTCDETHNSLQAILRGFRSPRSHAFVGEDLLSSLEAICAALKESTRAFEDLLSHDEYLTIISKFFKGRVGSQPESDALAKLRKEAEVRFKAKIPPGFADEKAKSGRDSSAIEGDPYGDYVGWAQILEYATNSQKDVLLVTDDRKSDWWIERHRGRSIGPLPALIEEFRRVTGRLFYMYAPDRFLEMAAERLKVPVDATTLKEVRDQSSHNPEPEKEIVPLSSSVHSPKLYESQAIDDLSNVKASAPVSDPLKDDPPEPSGGK